MRGGVWDMSSTCVQGGLPRPLGGYQPNLIMEPHSPAPAWQMHHPIIPKQEPMEDERNDSGITSGSDFHSSSPGSENSQDYNSQSQNVSVPTTSSYYTTPLLPRVSTTSPLDYQVNLPMHLNYQPMSSPQDHLNKSHFAPSNSETENVENEDPLKRLQTSLEKNGLMSTPTSSKVSEHSGDDDNKSDMEGEEYDEQGLRVPRMNSHGKVKTFKCKQCDFVAITKLDFWEHSKGHIKYDKLLTCPKCPFVTEYKHHLEYHLRNHFGSKPFKCDKCNYSCVNKSMLNSHMKSHSNVYQYRCAECSYATKYCHSLKLHLRKYSHKPAMVLNPDGTPNPLPIIDVYGTRRGPKQRLSQKMEESEAPPSMLQNQLTHFMLNNTPQMQLPFPYHFLAGFPSPMSNPLLFPPSIEQLGNPQDHSSEPEQLDDKTKSSPLSSPKTTAAAEALDLSKPEISTDQPAKNRRKGRAFKLETLPHNDSSDEDSTTEKNLASPPARSPQEKDEVTTNNNNNNNNNHSFDCQYCNIAFGDIVLYTMHMGYHGFKDPFTCNMCGEQCQDKVSFFLHIARNPHT